MSGYINVKGPGNDNKVILWERDPKHPNGEIFVVNDGETYKVAETPDVKRRIGDGRLVVVETAKPAAADDSKGDKKPAA